MHLMLFMASMAEMKQLQRCAQAQKHCNIACGKTLD